MGEKSLRRLLFLPFYDGLHQIVCVNVNFFRQRPAKALHGGQLKGSAAGAPMAPEVDEAGNGAGAPTKSLDFDFGVQIAVAAFETFGSFDKPFHKYTSLGVSQSARYRLIV